MPEPQFWRIINLDKRETTGLLGKLGDCLFDNVSPRMLVPLVNRSIEPPSLFDEIAKGMVEKPSLGIGKLQLPADILRKIFDAIEDLQDAVCFGLTNRLSLTIGREHIFALLLARMSAWAGDRLICVGDDGRDAPHGLLTDAEKDELRQLRTQSKVEHHRTTDDGGFSLYDLASNKFQPRAAEGDYGNRDLAIFERSLPWSEQRMFAGLTEAKYPSGPWVLCNLSKREYVREEVFADVKLSPPAQDVQDGPTGTKFAFHEDRNTKRRYVTFGEVIMSRICWSSNPSVTMRYKGNIHRGVWAGDRFEITTKRGLESFMKGTGGWRDVTEEVVKEVMKIWEADFGDSTIWESDSKVDLLVLKLWRT